MDYHKLINDNTILIQELQKELKPFFDKKNKDIKSKLENKFGGYYTNILYYNGHKSHTKYTLSQINDYYKQYCLFGDISYYKYNKQKNVYSHIDYVRYKFFEYYNAKYQPNKEILHYIYFFQFLDFIMSHGRLIGDGKKLIDYALNLFPGFLSKIQCLEYCSRYRPVYYYKSIINVELTNNIGISKFFTAYPYSIRFLVYKISKEIKKNTDWTQGQIQEYIEKEMENKKNKVSSKFKKGGAEHNSVLLHIMNIISDEQNIGAEDRTVLGILGDTGDIPYIDGNDKINSNKEYLEEYDKKIKNILMSEYSNHKNLNSNDLLIILYLLFQKNNNLDYLLFLNNKYGTIENNKFLALIHIIKTKQGNFGIKRSIPINNRTLFNAKYLLM